jgi:Sigma-70 region 2
VRSLGNCRNLADAGDLSQETMARGHERWETVRNAASPRAYVYTIALNLRRSALRRAALAIRHRLPDPADPDEPYTVAERRAELPRALRSLPPSQREALPLVEWVRAAPEDLDRTLQPVRTRQRNRRVAASTTAFLVAAGGIWLAWRHLARGRETSPVIPAPEQIVFTTRESQLVTGRQQHRILTKHVRHDDAKSGGLEISPGRV